MRRCLKPLHLGCGLVVSRRERGQTLSSASNELTDWQLFEELFVGELAPEDSYGAIAETYTIQLFSTCLWSIHDIVCNGGAEVFSAKHSCSAE